MTRPAPAEFAEFVREVSIRALDRLADHMKDLAAGQRQVVRAWSRMSRDQKDGLLSELLSAALASTPPAEPAGESEPRREIRRYDPEEVAATLPAKLAKPRKKKSAPKT